MRDIFSDDFWYKVQKLGFDIRNNVNIDYTYSSTNLPQRSITGLTRPSHSRPLPRFHRLNSNISLCTLPQSTQGLPALESFDFVSEFGDGASISIFGHLESR